MRIQAGWAKGTELQVPKGLETRPTSGKVRAAVVNMLAPYLTEASVLDLCAGSGGLGLEAVSIGAKQATFVEAAAAAVRCLRSNIAEVQRRAAKQELDTPPLHVVQGELPLALMRLSRLAGLYGVVYLDPPYRQAVDLSAAVATELLALTTAEAVFAIETNAKDGAALLDQVAPAWSVLKQRTYGDTMLTILRKTARADEEPTDA